MESKVKRSFWDIWTSYAIYYFGKVNLSIVVPALLCTYQNLNIHNMGIISSGFFAAYAIGQFVHGQISEKFNPFKYIAIGLIGSAIASAFLGFSAGFFGLLLVGEIIDGFFQSMGWSSCVRANSIIQKPEDREKSATILGTSYQIGNSIAWLVASYAVGRWGWSAGFFVSAIILLIRGILLLVTMPKINLVPSHTLKKQIKCTLTLPIVLSGIALCLLNMVRYGVITWIPLYLFQIGNFTVKQMGKVGLQIFLIPIFGVIGTLVYNKLKFKKDLISIWFLCLLALSFIIFPLTKGWLSILVLLIGSFFLYGPHVFLVTTFPTRCANKQIVAASTGFIDGMGYIGTIAIGLIVPYLVKGKDWDMVFLFWAGISFLVMFTVALTYYKYKQIEI